MIAFKVNNMICGQCIGGITEAVNATDLNAAVRVDLEIPCPHLNHHW
jgi:copper chaperone CopZ